MRTERKVDAIVFDWLREGLEERLAELLRALEQLSEGENVTEHVFDATQALQTIDRVFAMVDIQLVRVLIRTQLVALEAIERTGVENETALSAQIESAALLRALLDRMSTGSTVNAASLLPMVNRLRTGMGQPALDVRDLAARGYLLQAEHELDKLSLDTDGLTGERLRQLLRQMEREVLSVMRDDWSVLPGLRDLSMRIIAHERSRSAIIAVQVFGELLRLTEQDPERYAPLLKRAVGRVLQLFRLQLSSRSEVVIDHAGLDLGATVLGALLDHVDDDAQICSETAAEWRAQLDGAEGEARFVGLDAHALGAVAEALQEEILATQDVLDLFARGKRDDLEPLNRITSRFRQMSGVLGALGYVAASDALDEGAGRLQEVIDGDAELDDRLLMDLAGTVMLVEQVVAGIPSSMGDAAMGATLHDQTVAESIGAIATAAYENLASAREKVNAGLAGEASETASDRANPFRQAADILGGIGEVLRLADRDAALPLVEALARWTRAQSFGTPVGDEHTLSALSEVFAAVEFYLENLRDFGKEIVRFLDGPKQRVEDLLATVEPRAEQPGAESMPDAAEVAPAEPGEPETQTEQEALLDFWQIEPEPEPVSESPAAPTSEEAAGHELEQALDFALDEGDREQRLDAAVSRGGGDEPSHDLPDEIEAAPETPGEVEATGEVPTSEQADVSAEAQAPGDELAPWLTDEAEEEPTASWQSSVDGELPLLPQEADEPEAHEAGSETISDEILDMDLPSAPADHGLGIGWSDEPTATAEHEPADEAPLELPEKRHEGEGTLSYDETDREGPAPLDMPDADRTGADELTTALDFGLADEQSPSEIGTTEPLAEREEPAEKSTDLPDEVVETPETPSGAIEREDVPARDETGAESLEAEATREVEQGMEEPVEPAAEPEADEDPMMQEMREVFAEEMGETLPEMVEAATAWRDAGDGDALVNLRRGFHTIKGSGRMVGLDGIGEWAWSWERLLNGVIDGKVAGSDAIQAGAAEAVGLMEAALPDLESGRPTPDSHWAASRELAERLEAGEEPDASAEQAPGGEAVAEVAEPVTVDETPAETEVSPIIEDPVLREIFDQEIGGYIHELHEKIAEARENGVGLTCDNELVRLLHTTLGSARTAGVDVIATLAHYLEEWTRILSVHHEGLVGRDLDLFAEGADMIEALRRWAVDPGHEVPDSSDIERRLGFRYEQALAHYGEMTESVEARVSRETTRGESDAEGGLEESDAAAPAAVDTPLPEHDDSLPAPTAEVPDVAESFDEPEARTAWATGNEPGDAAAVTDSGEPPAEPEQVEEVTVESPEAPVEPDLVEAEAEPDVAEAEAEPDVAEAEPDVAEVADSEEEPAGAEALEPEPEAAEPWQPADEVVATTEPEAFDDIEERPDDDPADQDEDILQIFLDEADELLEQADAYLAHWRVYPNDLESIRLLHRNLHTLKGGARMAGLLNLGDVAHHLEGRLDTARHAESGDNESLVALVQHSYDVIAGLLDRVRNQQPVPQQRELIALIRDPAGAQRFVERGQQEEPGEDAAQAGPTEPEAAEPETAPVSEPVAETPEKPEAPAVQQEAAPERRDEQVRVAAGSIDELVNQISESVLLQSRIDRQVNGFERQLFELQQTVTRLRSQLRRLEIETETQIKADLIEEAGISEEQFDPLEFDRFTQVQELSRGIMESLGDVANIEETLSSLTEQSQLMLLQQSRLGRKMQDGALAMRLVRFNDSASRLRRIVRQVGDEMGRQAELVIENGDAELDRVTLMALLPSLEHMLRNSLAHGIEPPEERLAANKNPVGRLLLSVDSAGGNVTVSLRDDGRGLDLDAIRRKAVERALIPSDVDVSDEEARSLIFLPGFSTAGNVSQVAGRGVGMDVVASATRELGGFVDIDSELGRYTEIRLNLPLTQAMTKGILIANGDDRYAIPYKGVVAVTRMTGVALAELYREDKPQFEYDGEQYPLYYLGELLWGQSSEEAAQDVAAIRPVMLFKLGERRFALHVDHQLGGIQLFVKSLGPQLGRIPGLSGATIADDGDVILVLELFELVQQFQRRDYQRRLGEQAGLKPKRERPTVLVVDDSLTVRKVTARTLERNNYDVVLARDGVEALGVLQDKLPDLVLTDIEMPRMDGFELLGAIRNDRTAADTPVIMISSRTGQKHRNRAEALGVSAYLGKPYTEMELIETIERLSPREVIEGQSADVQRPVVDSGVGPNAD
ncbi:MAG: Hpt domain-containing protein [Guyparkeria sp.]